MSNQLDIRRLYFALGVATVVVGLVVRFHGEGMASGARDVIGDALWATMIACWISMIAPSLRPSTRYVAALLVCFAVETSQLWRTPALDYARSTRIGPLVLGSGFDPRDFVAYAIGIAGFIGFDRRLLRHRTPSHGTSRISR